jgi:microcystin-dependent protein
MPRQANGTYVQPANTAAVSGQPISSTAFNTLETDIGTEITNSLDRLGRSAMQAPLPMGGNKITGMADPTVSTDAVTKNYADTQVATFFSTGDVKLTLKTAADTGWLLFDDGTFGSASSGGSNRANNDTQALFTLLYNAPFTDANVPILTSGGGATTRVAQGSASAAWAANCRMSLPKTLGRALAVAGSGAGLTSYIMGQTTGENTHTLALTEIPAGIQSVNVAGFGVTVTSNAVIATGATGENTGGGQFGFNIPSGFNQQVTSSGGVAAGNVFSSSDNTGGGAHNNMQPTTFLNAMVKL